MTHQHRAPRAAARQQGHHRQKVDGAADDVKAVVLEPFDWVDISVWFGLVWVRMLFSWVQMGWLWLVWLVGFWVESLLNWRAVVVYSPALYRT